MPKSAPMADPKERPHSKWLRHPVSLGLSLALHMGLFLILFFSPSFQAEAPAPVELEVFTSSPSPATPSTLPAEKRQADGSTALRKKILKDSLKMKMTNYGTTTTGITISGETPLPESEGSGAWVEQVPFQQGLELSAFFQRLLERMDRGLDYPEDMAIERIRGDVRLDFYVDKQGRIQGDFHSVKGSNYFLNLYVMSALLVLLRDPLPENLWAQDDRIALSVHVQFETYEFAETATKSYATNQNNEFTLKRARYVQPLAIAKIEKIFTHYIPPVIILPGYIYVDVIRLAKLIDNIGEPDPDDQRKERLHLRRDQLELAIKKKEVPAG